MYNMTERLHSVPGTYKYSYQVGGSGRFNITSIHVNNAGVHVFQYRELQVACVSSGVQLEPFAVYSDCLRCA